ncbi:hypothetical protein CDG76_01590 [Nostoc sp. 'Peltigera membranacea cyanobiont' 210A]|uniref:carbohydrate-binding module family 14 protein n=1 Tax=Nostoc sp. 'Peltigera membranacea cyanobiont' 210A TaxID=2014529 RepID=UPI000B959FFE|nr:carbohydrate-binding module family 14 protein [Nostoc sp. 'Peltigera membranacea cyanobiont' 210A]OYD97598.1 hypothetical protein CDG76_01590 [Nostoc sp. 'Peltigera membranacea cyanobiont' 210A]
MGWISYLRTDYRDSLINESHPEYACGPEDVDTLYPDPNNRSSFYQCAPYGLVLQSCPNGLVFDENVGRCEWDSQPAKETEAKN